MSEEDVLVVTHPLAPASENHVESLLDIIAAISTVALVTTNLRDESEIREKYEVNEISAAGMHDSIFVAAIQFIFNQFRMCHVLTKREENVVLFFGATAYVLPVLWARIVGKTVLLEPRGDVPLTLRLQWEQRVPSSIARVLAGAVWILERVGYALSHRIITYTPAMAEQLGLNPAEPTLHPHGARYVDTERFSPTTPFEERDCVVGFLGRLDEEKGIRNLAAVAQALPDEITFRFIGDGDLRGWLENELESEIEQGTVEVSGWVDHDEVPAQLNELQLLILPSQPTEGLPTVILESLACGTPVYATPVSGVPDVVKEGKTGYLMRESDPETIASRISQIQRDEKLATVSENGRTLIEQKFSFEGAVERYRRILESL